MALVQLRMRASDDLCRNRWNATTRSTEGIGIMTVTARNMGIQGRLARDPQFFPKNGEKEAVTYARILNDEYAFGGKDADGKSQFVKETVGYNLELTGGLAEAFAQTHKKGDLVLAIANRDEWTGEREGKKYDNVTYHVKAIGESLTLGSKYHQLGLLETAKVEADKSLAASSAGLEALNTAIRNEPDQRTAYPDPTEPNFGPTSELVAAPNSEMAQSIK